MRILVLSDIHGSTTGAMTAMELCGEYEPDLVVLCGDITNFGPHAWANAFLRRIPHPKAAVPGNCDPDDLQRVFNGSGTIDLHRRKEMIGGLPFAGAGGSGHTRAGTLFEVEDDQFMEWLMPLMEQNMVLVTHAPAHGFLDTDRSGSHRGSHSLRTLVDEWNPILMLSGHMHESRGIIRHGGTVFVNPGPARDGYGALVEVTVPETGGSSPLAPADSDAIRASVRADLLKV